MEVSYDIKLNNVPYMFFANPGIKLGAALTEPARPSEVGSAVIASLHGGIGRAFDEGGLRYKEASYADLTVPGEWATGYTEQTVDTFTATGISKARPAFGFGNGGEGTVYVIGGQVLKWFDPENPGGGLKAVTIGGVAFPANSELSGSAFQYNSQLIFGVIDNTAANEGKPAARVSANASETANPAAATLSASNPISYGVSTRGRAFWIESDVYLKYTAMITGATFKGAAPYVEFPATGGIELGFPRTRWLAMLGSSLLLFRSDGVIVGASENGQLAVAGTVPTSGLDRHFGRRSNPFLDGMLIPGQQGLWSFDLHSLTLRPYGPNYLQSATEDRLRGEVSAVGSAGPYGFLALRRVSSGGAITSRGYAIVHYSNLIAVHDLIADTATNEVITDFFAYYDSTTRQTKLYYLVFNESTLVTTVKYKPLRLPTDQTVSNTNLNAASAVQLAAMAGPQPAANMTKLWTQVRGHFERGSAANPSLVFSGFALDGNAVNIASVSATGSFAVPITATGNENRLLARELSAGTITITNGAYDTNLPLPLTFDFVWVPDTQDALTLQLIVSGEVEGNIGGSWHRPPWTTAKALLALRGTIVSMVFPEGDSWTVLVEAVEERDIREKDGAGQTARVAEVQIRRIS